MGLYRAVGKVVCSVSATGVLSVPPVRQFATAKAKPRKPKRRIDMDRPRPGHGEPIWGCNPWSLWNTLLLGRWTEFDFHRLMRAF
jgi:hypothetical protein